MTQQRPKFTPYQRLVMGFSASAWLLGPAALVIIVLAGLLFGLPGHGG